jgi:hypothetical protein
MDTVANGEIEIHHIAGTDNGTLILSGFETTAVVFGVDCRYGYGSKSDAGVITGGLNRFSRSTWSSSRPSAGSSARPTPLSRWNSR